MAPESLFGDDASTDVPGIWFVAHTTPIVYNQPNPGEVYFILGYDLEGIYPDRTGDELNAEAVDPVDDEALAEGATIKFVTELAIRNESSNGAKDGTMRMQMSVASDMMQAAASQPFAAAALARAQLAVQVRPWYTVYRIPLAELVDIDDNFDWLQLDSLEISADVWEIAKSADEIRTVIFDPHAVTIDDANLLFDAELADGEPSPPSDSEVAAAFPAPLAPVGYTVNMMWIDIVTAGVRYGPLRDILSWKQEEIWNEGSRFSFTAVEKGAAVHVEGLSEVYAYGIIGGHVTLMGAGLALNVDAKPDQTQTTLSVSGIGFEHELLGQPRVDLEFSGISHGDVVSELASLLPDGWSLHADPEIVTRVAALKLSASSLLGAIRKCAEIFNTRLQFDADRTIRMRTHYTPLEIAASNEPGLGAHIIDLVHKTHAKEIATVLHPFASDGRARLADVTDTPPEGFDVDADAGTVTHSSARARYGDWHQEHNFRSIVSDDDNTFGKAATANILLALAVERLRQYGEPQVTYNISVQEPRQLIRPFHELVMKVRTPRVDDSFRVASVSTTFDQATGLRQATVLTTQQSVRLVDDISLLARRLQDLAEAAALNLAAGSRVYTGVAETSFTNGGGGGPKPVYFVANPGHNVEAFFAIERPGAGHYQYAVDARPAAALEITDDVDLSDEIKQPGTHSLAVDLSTTPADASRVRVRVVATS